MPPVLTDRNRGVRELATRSDAPRWNAVFDAPRPLRPEPWSARACSRRRNKWPPQTGRRRVTKRPCEIPKRPGSDQAEACSIPARSFGLTRSDAPRWNAVLDAPRPLRPEPWSARACSPCRNKRPPQTGGRRKTKRPCAIPERPGSDQAEACSIPARRASKGPAELHEYQPDAPVLTFTAPVSKHQTPPRNLITPLAFRQ
jgi:hypothetical protein